MKCIIASYNITEIVSGTAKGADASNYEDTIKFGF